MQKVPDAFVVTVIRESGKEMTVADVIIGSIGIVGALLLLALMLGVVAGAILVFWNRRHPASNQHLPPVKPTFTDAGLPPSSRAQ